METRKVLTALLMFALLIGGVTAMAQRGQHGFVPKVGFVPDATTAQKIAEAVLVPVYGDKVVATERPFRATLKNEIWIVVGSVPCEAAPPGASCPGGAAEVRIRRKDGTVTFMSHGQ
jgi:hypothetical protein